MKVMNYPKVEIWIKDIADVGQPPGVLGITLDSGVPANLGKTRTDSFQQPERTLFGTELDF